MRLTEHRRCSHLESVLTNFEPVPLHGVAAVLCSQVVEEKMVKEMKELRSKIKIGIVGGSDLSKQVEQLGENGKELGGVYAVLIAVFFSSSA